jgi:hypothetical protein
MESETVVQTGRAAMIAQHVRENNLAYLVGCLIAHQMGLLDRVFTYGTGICG